MKFAACLVFAFLALAYSAPTEKIETISWEEQHQKTIHSAPVEKAAEEHHEEHHEVIEEHHEASNVPINEAAPFPQPVHVEHVNETETRVNIEELENKFRNAQSEGSEGLDKFLSMVSQERETLQRLYERMSIQAEQNVRGSLQKSKEWEENARLHAKNSLEKLLELQKRAEERTRELVERQASSVRCVECEASAVANTEELSNSEHVSSFHEEHKVEEGAEVQPAEHSEGESSYKREEVHEVHDSSSSNLDNVETTTYIEEWSTVLSEHSSTVIE